MFARSPAGDETTVRTMNWIGNSHVGVPAWRLTNSPRGFGPRGGLCLVWAGLLCGLLPLRGWAAPGDPTADERGGAGPEVFAGQGDEVNTLTPEHAFFLEFLTNRPAIKEIVWELSANRFTPIGADGKPAPLPVPFVPARGALQPGGFFWEYPTNQPNVMPCAYGESVDTYWTVDTNVVSLAPKSGPGAHPQNGAQFLVEYYRSLLLKLLLLGIEDAAPDSLEWLTPAQFEAVSHQNPLVRLTGRLSLDAEGLPAQLEYRAAGGPLLECRVDYRYDQRGRVLPGSVVHTRRTKDRPVEFYTNLLRRVEFGLLPKAAEGFRPSFFVDEQDRHRSLLIDSNAMTYRVTDMGLVLHMGVEPPAHALVKPPRSGWMAYALWGMAILSATFLVWKLTKPGKPHHQPPNKT